MTEAESGGDIPKDSLTFALCQTTFKTELQDEYDDPTVRTSTGSGLDGWYSEGPPQQTLPSQERPWSEAPPAIVKTEIEDMNDNMTEGQVEVMDDNMTEGQGNVENANEDGGIHLRLRSRAKDKCGESEKASAETLRDVVEQNNIEGAGTARVENDDLQDSNVYQNSQCAEPLDIHNLIGSDGEDSCNAKNGNKENVDINESNSTSASTQGKKQARKERRKTPFITDHIVQVEGNDALYKCTICSVVFKGQYRRKFHIYCDSVNGNRPYRCGSCGKEFVSVSHYDYHVQKMCGKHPSEPKLQKRNVLALSDPNLPPTKENPCVPETAYKSKLVFQCAYCNKLLQSKGAIQKHIAVFHTEADFKCPKCGKVLKDRNSLALHRRIHRPFRCFHCQKAFELRKDLWRHEIIHTGAKPWKCELCKTFVNNRKDNLVRHIRLRHLKDTKEALEIANKQEKRIKDELARQRMLRGENGLLQPNKESGVKRTSRGVKRKVNPRLTKNRGIMRTKGKNNVGSTRKRTLRVRFEEPIGELSTKGSLRGKKVEPQDELSSKPTLRGRKAGQNDELNTKRSLSEAKVEPNGDLISKRTLRARGVITR